MYANSRSIVAFCALALCASITQAARVPIPEGSEATVTMTADTAGNVIPYDIPLEFVDGIWKVGYYDDFGQLVDEITISRPGEWECTIKGSIDPDPAHDFTNTVTDIGAPTTFTFAVTSPMVPPIGFPNSVNASLVGGLTDLTSNGVSVAPVAPNTRLLISRVGVPLTSMGVDVGLAESGIGTYGPYSAGPIPGPGPGPWTTLDTTLAFTLSGGGDTFAFTLHSEIVPEPSSFVLAGIGGLAALAYAAIRRRKAA